MNNSFSVIEMASSMASDNNSSVDELFLKDRSDEESSSISETQHVEPKQPVKPSGWTPDESVLAGLPELTTGPVTYDRDEIGEDGKVEALRNLADDDAVESAGEQKDEMIRMYQNIESAKKRFGITKLQVPEGQMQLAMYDAASNNDPNKAAEELDQILNEFISTYPEFILEWEEGRMPENFGRYDESAEDDPSVNTEPQYDQNGNPITYVKSPMAEDEVKVVIDKTNLPEVSWTPEDMDKIRKARTVELNIVEGDTIELSEIDDADINYIDNVISEYVRKAGDVTACLPASRYRCTFTGLSYPEIMDLSTSAEMSTIDGELKKWTLCFNHISNQSIGPWEEYKVYYDLNGREVRLGINERVPNDISEDMIHIHTKFEDFMQKTSFMDLNFMIWKILCATTMETEIIQIECKSKLKNGSTCGHTYDWIYAPAELLEIESVPDEVVDEMEHVAHLYGSDALNYYNDGFLRKRRTVRLSNSGLYVVFGHISADTYMNKIYPEIIALQDASDDDPSVASKSLNYTTLMIVKEFLIKNEQTGRYTRISDFDAMLKILDNMSEIDWLTIGEVVRIAMQPYSFTYSLRGLVCPKCKKRSKITIENLSQLLFIVARSLSSVSVQLKTI